MLNKSVVEAVSDPLVGQSPYMQRLRNDLARVGACDVSVLLQGESGTGKELISRAIHAASRRREGPFIGVNCAAIHESLLEAELFGHEAGAFTGAGAATKGFLRAADGGTILLDEIGDMSPSLQSKLLRVLEERAVTPVGGTRAIPVDLRVIAATHRDLVKAVREGAFRLDLYYRLNVVCLDIPPLRQRPEDIPALAEHFLHQVARALCVPVRRLAGAALRAMMRYAWPGNVRQLANVIQRAYVMGDGPIIGLADLPAELQDAARAAPGAGQDFPTLQQVIREHVTRALQQSQGVRSRAARMLGIDRKSLWRMARRWDDA